jgi:hypothetical protein
MEEVLPKVHYVKRAGKDYPEHGIKKGEGYYWWKNLHGPKQFSKTKPNMSQTVASEKLAELFAIDEARQDFCNSLNISDGILSPRSFIENLSDTLTELAERLRNLGERYMESADNIEKGFGWETEQSLGIRGRGKELSNSADEWENLADDIREIDVRDTVHEEELIAKLDEAVGLISGLDIP